MDLLCTGVIICTHTWKTTDVRGAVWSKHPRINEKEVWRRGENSQTADRMKKRMKCQLSLQLWEKRSLLILQTDAGHSDVTVMSQWCHSDVLIVLLLVFQPGDSPIQHLTFFYVGNNMFLFINSASHSHHFTLINNNNGEKKSCKSLFFWA